MTPPTNVQSEMQVLAALGFGPETLLKNDPKLFIDHAFLAALMVELREKLGAQSASRAIFQIGLLYGLRDAYRIVHSDSERAGRGIAESPLLALSLEQCVRPDKPGCLEIPGSWPEQYEAEAHLSKLGPESQPSCALSAGYTSGWLSATFDCDILAIEEACATCGEDSCRFVAREVSDWRSQGDERVSQLLPEIAFDVFREISQEFVSGQNVDSEQARLDFDSGMIHVWGQVMVLPLSNLDEAIYTVEMLGRNPQTRPVRVVVIDLMGEHLDDGFGAAGLEQILETLEAWGAEAILTNVSPLTERVVADLETKHILLRKDLPEAVASAFQIAAAQRHLL